MKKYIVLLFLSVFVTSCSPFSPEISKSKSEYVKSVVVCDSKIKDFEITNYGDIADFFDGSGGSVKIEYRFKERKGSRHYTAKEVEILRGRTRKEEKRFYIARFKRKTFPFSDCRKLKTKPKYFK